MADVKWIKINTDIFDNEKILLIEAMPDADALIVMWFRMLCLAGKKNNNGVFRINDLPYTDEMFATIFKKPVNTVRLALETYEKLGMIEITDGAVTLPSWGRHQSLDALEAKKKYDRERKAKQREEQRLLQDVVGQSCDSRRTVVGSSYEVPLADKIRKEQNRTDETKSEINQSNDGFTDSNIDFASLIRSALRLGHNNAANAYYLQAKRYGIEVDIDAIKAEMR